MKKDELWELYDRHAMPTGEIIKRDDPIPEGRYHVGVSVCIINSKGEILIQKRQITKTVCPGLWDFGAGGSALAGETPEQGAMRETYEELGIRVDLNETRPHFIYFTYDHVSFNYLVQMDVDLKDITIQEEEVMEVRWATKEEVLAMIESGEFCQVYPSFINLCCDMTGGYGVDIRQK